MVKLVKLRKPEHKKGRRSMKLRNIIRMPQNKLHEALKSHFGGSRRTISHDKEYLLVPGKAPVMLIAHLDTVHKQRCVDICTSGNGNILMSPQGIGGDDRCGVFGLTQVHSKCLQYGIPTPWLLFTWNEESGGVGASTFTDDIESGMLNCCDFDFKYLIELDRKGSTDAVFYECANKEFIEYVECFGFRKAYGSFSDISTIAPVIGAAAVNLSIGYYNAHQTHEHINLKELNHVIDMVVSMVEDACTDKCQFFEYVEMPVKSWNKWSTYDYNFSILDGEDDEDDEEWFMQEQAWPTLITVDSNGQLIPAAYLEAYSDLVLEGWISMDELDALRAKYGDSVIMEVTYDTDYWIDEALKLLMDEAETDEAEIAKELVNA